MKSSKRGVVLLGALIAFLLCVNQSSSARIQRDAFDFLNEVMRGNEEERKCKLCLCTLSIPPQCFCADALESCPDDCNHCACHGSGNCYCQDQIDEKHCNRFAASQKPHQLTELLNLNK